MLLCIKTLCMLFTYNVFYYHSPQREKQLMRVYSDSCHHLKYINKIYKFKQRYRDDDDFKYTLVVASLCIN